MVRGSVRVRDSGRVNASFRFRFRVKIRCRGVPEKWRREVSLCKAPLEFTTNRTTKTPQRTPCTADRQD